MDELPHRVYPARLSPGKAHRFELAPEAEARAALAERLGLSGLRKLRFAGELSPERQADWVLTAHLGATVVQPCTVTLEPVTTRLDETVVRRYRAELAEPQGEEAEMPEDETEERLPDVIDLDAVMEEALALALPLYPRAEGADLGAATFAAPGVAPLTDEDAHPMAALAKLKRKVE